ncbi:MerR family DNA-binding transcriptional regulator [Vibrio parahaemolyticus]|nr:MerR family DNA-binding transcriptional regulator [Vibrio parahaemolyticus]
MIVISIDSKISVGRAAEKLGVSVPTIRRWEKTGKLPQSERTSGNHRRFDMTELRVFLRAKFELVDELPTFDGLRIYKADYLGHLGDLFGSKEVNLASMLYQFPEINVYREYAIKKHGKQTYGSELPYVFHLDDIALIMYSMMHGLKEDETLLTMIGACYCHDVIEDTGTSKESLAKTFTGALAEMVQFCTKPEDVDRLAALLALIEKINNVDASSVVCFGGMLCKMADGIGNRYRCMIGADKKSKSLGKRYQKELGALFPSYEMFLLSEVKSGSQKVVYERMLASLVPFL